jgi:hypothetical protein
LALIFLPSFWFYHFARGWQIFKALHWAYYRAAANPFLKLHTPLDAPTDHVLAIGSPQWTSFRRRVDEVVRAAGAPPVDSGS